MADYYAMIADGVVKIVFGAVALVLAMYVLPWIKEHRLYERCLKLVKAAEKLGEVGAIPKETKKAWVVSQLEKLGVKVTPFVDALIEAAVEELDLAIESGVVVIEDEIVVEDDPVDCGYEHDGELPDIPLADEA